MSTNRLARLRRSVEVEVHSQGALTEKIERLPTCIYVDDWRRQIEQSKEREAKLQQKIVDMEDCEHTNIEQTWEGTIIRRECLDCGQSWENDGKPDEDE